MRGHARPSTGERPPRRLTSCCNQPKQALLRRPLESAEIAVPIRIESPEQDSSGARFCRYETAWPHGRWSSAGWGVDAVQAVLLTMQKIGTEIYASEYHKLSRLLWTAPGRGYGFPV